MFDSVFYYLNDDPNRHGTFRFEMLAFLKISVKI